MKLLSATLIACLFSFQLTAQEFEIIRETVVYEDTLAMDVFVPIDGDMIHPLLIYVHGGGFSGGKRDEANHIAFCERMARDGWVTATISYHLTMKGKSFGCDQAAQNKIRTIETAARNIHQATAFLMEHEVKYLVNSEKIVIAGSSAGAEAAIQAAYWEKTRKGILPNDFQYAGVISMAGALLDINWITRRSAIPTALFHGTCDPLVPYGNAAHHYCDTESPGFLMLYGSSSIAERLRKLGAPYYLLSDCGGGHEWASLPINEEHDYMIRDFLWHYVASGKHQQTEATFHLGKMDCDMDVCK